MNLCRKLATGLMAGVTAGLLATAAQAAPITAPAGLSAGDTYRLAFVTSTTTDATSNDIGYYNNFVNSLANGIAELAALGTSWTAIVSTAVNGPDGGTNARTNTNTNAADPAFFQGFYLLDGTTMIAGTNADLWDGTLLAALSINETGVSDGGDQVWTGTDTDGTRNPGLGLGGGNDGLASVGRDNQSGFTWIVAGIVNPQSIGNQHNLYALSGLLTVEAAVEVPEPGTLVILVLGLAGLGFARRRRAG